MDDPDPTILKNADPRAQNKRNRPNPDLQLTGSKYFHSDELAGHKEAGPGPQQAQRPARPPRRLPQAKGAQYTQQSPS